MKNISLIGLFLVMSINIKSFDLNKKVEQKDLSGKLENLSNKSEDLNKSLKDLFIKNREDQNNMMKLLYEMAENGRRQGVYSYFSF